jgi:hypothetical protein
VTVPTTRVLFAATLAFGACRPAEDPATAGPAPDPSPTEVVPMKLSSSAFTHQGPIPTEHTCEGADTSPPLAWSDVPEGTVSFALVVDDPDAPDPAAPKRVWVHWVLFDLPADVRELAANGSATGLPAGTRTGKNDWGKASWGGPCPPIGRHRYFHRVYALDRAFPDLAEPTKAELLAAIEGHVLGTAELVGTYEKTGG